MRKPGIRVSHLVALAALSGAMAVIAGAFGAHGVSGQPAEWLKTGGQYQMLHAIAAIVVVRWTARPARAASAMFLGGSFVFAATLYAMALGAPRWLGAVTPLGGLGMIAGWLVLAIGALRKKRATSHSGEGRNPFNTPSKVARMDPGLRRDDEV